MAKTAAKIAGPSWSLEDEFPSLASDKLRKDLKFVESETQTLEVRAVCAGFALGVFRSEQPTCLLFADDVCGHQRGQA